jgi:protochlorophyllide reductase
VEARGGFGGRARTAIVTGANSGIGFEVADALAAAGMQVILACRSRERGLRAAAALESRRPDACVLFEELDLASLASIRDFASRLSDRIPAIDLLVNNAGVMATPLLRTRDGFELQLGTNHLGHFALTGRLMPLLLRGIDPRVIQVSSLVYPLGRSDFERMVDGIGYGAWRAYATSKLANLLFVLGLQQRARERGWKLAAVACHPGYVATKLQAESARLSGSRTKTAMMWLGNVLVARPAVEGARCVLHAARADGVQGGDFIGPSGITGRSGEPVRLPLRRCARDPAAADALWELSEKLTGVQYPS